MLNVFRYIAFVEGVTTLVLFGIAMPLKYWAGNPAMIRPTGWIHGIAFLIYIVAMTPALWGRGFTLLQWLRTFLAAFVPFGTFLNDPMLRRRGELSGGPAGHAGPEAG